MVGLPGTFTEGGCRSIMLRIANGTTVCFQYFSRSGVDCGPKTGFIPTRSTEQVFLEVIDSAKSDVFVVSYVFYNATAITDALARAIARGVSVKVLLESSIAHGGGVHGDSINAVADSATGADCYIWDSTARAQQNTALSAVVHAKCVVADGELAFITSANLTSAALDRNMELGVLLRHGSTPRSLKSHFAALITTNEIRRWKPR